MFTTVQDALKACELAGYEPRHDVSGLGEDRFYVWLPGSDSEAATCYWCVEQFISWASAHFRRRSAAAVAGAQPQS